MLYLMLLSILCLFIGLYKCALKFSMLDQVSSFLFSLSVLPTVITYCAFLVFIFPYDFYSIKAFVVAPFFILSMLLLIISRSGAEKKHNVIKKNVNITYVVIFVLLLNVPFINALYSQIFISHIDHDASIYFLQSSVLAREYLNGQSILELLTGINSSHSHGALYNLYLSWGFLYDDSARFPYDLLPKILITLNHLSAICSMLFFVSLKLSVDKRWVIFFVMFVPYISTLEYQFSALSRDTYYISPLIIFAALSLNLKPYTEFTTENVINFFCHILVFLLLLTSTILGHSLGIFYVGLAAAAVFCYLVYLYKFQALLIFECWVVLLYLLFFFIYMYLKFTTEASGDIGFVYPYYTDPILKDNFIEQTNFLRTPSLVDVFKKFFVSDILYGIPLCLIIITMPITCFKMVKDHLRIEVEMYYFLFFTIILITFSLLVFPIKLDGITILGAFYTNIRYPFFINILSVLLCFYSFVILTNLSRDKDFKLLLSIVFFSIYIYTSSSLNNMYNMTINPIETKRAYAHKDSCRSLIEKGVRKIYIDNEGMLYRCDVNAYKLFSENGAYIISSRNESEFEKRIMEQGVDAFIFRRSIYKWWKGVGLYEYLIKNWVVVENNNGNPSLIFIRPTLYKENVNY